MTSESPAQRLGRLVRARRKELKLTQADVQKAGGPSTATLRLIEGGKHADIRPSTSGPLETALQWQLGSVDRVLAGDEPTPMSSAHRLAPAEFSRAVELARQIVNAPPTPHDEHFNRAERLLSHAHESVRHGDHLGAIHGLEGVWSTIELLIDRITDAALQKGRPNAGQSTSSANQDAQSAAPPPVDKNEKTTGLADDVESPAAAAADAVTADAVAELEVDGADDDREQA